MSKKIKYFYINVDKDIEKNNHMKEQLNIYDIQCERVGAKLAASVIERSMSCRYTHLSIIEKIKDDEIFIIFEDDVIIEQNLFEQMINKLPDKQWCMLNFGVPTRGVNGYDGEPCFKRAIKTVGSPGVNTGTWAYAINGEQVHKVLAIFENKDKNSPHWDVQLKENFDKINYYWCYPKIVTHGNYKFKSTRIYG